MDFLDISDILAASGAAKDELKRKLDTALTAHGRIDPA
jgi:hypothetical protein